MMTDMEVQERILFKEDAEKIKAYGADLTFRVAQTMKILNKIAENYSFDSLDQFPVDVDAWILKLYLSRNRKAKEQYEWQPFRLSEINLPEDLTALRSDIQSWHQWDHKDSIHYLNKSKEGYSVNSELVQREISRFAETQKTYIEGAQIVRLKICDDILFGVEYEVKKSGLDFNSDSMRASLLKRMLSRNPFLTYVGFKPNRMGNYFAVNENYILTGSLNF